MEAKTRKLLGIDRERLLRRRMPTPPPCSEWRIYSRRARAMIELSPLFPHILETDRGISLKHISNIYCIQQQQQHAAETSLGSTKQDLYLLLLLSSYMSKKRLCFSRFLTRSSIVILGEADQVTCDSAYIVQYSSSNSSGSS